MTHEIFFALKSRHAEKNTVEVIYNADGVKVSSQQEIETAHYAFYQKLYSCEGVDFHIQRNFLSNLDVLLNDTDRTLCERALSADEIFHVVHSLSQGKTPGSDGFPQKFYVKFWDQLCPILLELNNFSLEQGFLSSSMQESVTPDF